MSWGQILNSENMLPLVLPLGAGVAVAVVAYILRRLLYRYIHSLTAKTKTCFDDILVRDTRLVSILWCLWLGIYTGLRLAKTPESWTETIEKDLLVIFVALGIYTAIVVIMATLKWYRIEVCPKTRGNLDDMLLSIMIFGTPVLGGILGIITILNMLGYGNADVNDWLAEHGGKLAILLVIGVTLVLLTIVAVPRIIQKAVRNSPEGQTEDELKKRADTLTSVIVTTVQMVIILVMFFMVLSEVGIDIVPFIASASVLGVAVGFGAQSLVKDILAGMFIIMENQYRKGDVVRIADVSGAVEEINLRRTILRDMDGVIHVVPNGEIRVASNYTKQLSRVNLNISVSYYTDLDKAIAVINRVGKELAEDPNWLGAIISSPRALRVDNLGDSGIEIKIVGETKPSRQWDVTGELRLRLKKAFDKEGIEIPWPTTKVYFGNQPPLVISGAAEMPVKDKNQTEKLN